MSDSGDEGDAESPLQLKEVERGTEEPTAEELGEIPLTQEEFERNFDLGIEGFSDEEIACNERDSPVDSHAGPSLPAQISDHNTHSTKPINDTRTLNASGPVGGPHSTPTLASGPGTMLSHGPSHHGKGTILVSSREVAYSQVH